MLEAIAATTSGTKNVTTTVAPHLTAAYLTTLMATPVEQMTVKQHDGLTDALKRVKGGDYPAATIGSLLT